MTTMMGDFEMRRGERRYMIIPCLAAKMKTVGATYKGLAFEAGSNVATISCARRGKPVLLRSGLALLDALNNRKCY